MAKAWKVVSRFADKRAPGGYVAPGADWTPADEVQAVRLERAGCVVRLGAAPPAPPAGGKTRKPAAAPLAPPRPAGKAGKGKEAPTAPPVAPPASGAAPPAGE